VIEDMTSSSFINALRRFNAVRGHVKEFRSGRGINFIGSTENLGVDVINVEDRPIKEFLLNQKDQHESLILPMLRTWAVRGNV
jgi:hypothetical protein